MNALKEPMNVLKTVITLLNLTYAPVAVVTLWIVDGRNCTDIDECALNRDGCAQNCQNIIGSYVCSCNVGYRLNADRHTCGGKCVHMTLYAHLASV